MPQLIEVPGQGVVEFPDGMTDDQIAAAIRGDKQDGKSMLRRLITNLGAGAVRGAGSIGATLLTPIDAAARAVGVQNDFIGRTDRREAMDQGLQMLGADPESLAYKGAKLGAEIAGTMGVGGTVAKGFAGVAPRLAESVATAGLRAGGATGATGVGLRAVGGGVTGAASAGLVNPDDAATGGMIGAALPGALQVAGAAGRAAARPFRSGKKRAAETLVDALELPAQDVVRRLSQAEVMVPGSMPTVSQVIGSPQASILERVVAESPGGAALKERYLSQNTARLGLLDQVAPVDPRGAAAARQDFGAAAISAIQRGDEAARARTRQLYEAVPQDEAALYLPDLGAIRDQFFPAGAFGGRDAADMAVRTAQQIGSVQLPSVARAGAGSSTSLAQAVRKAGGLSIGNNSGLRGELAGLRGDLKNLVRVNGGMSPDRMAQKMFEAGYLPDDDAATLLAALRDEATGSRAISASDDLSAFARARDAAMGDAPDAVSAPQKVTLRQFDALRKSIGNAERAAVRDPERATEAAALGKMKQSLDDRIDEVVRGDGAIDEDLPIAWADQLSAARKAKRDQVAKFRTGPQAEVFRMGSDGLPKVQGSQLASLVWGQRPGIADDIKQFRKVLDEHPRLLGQFKSMVTTEGAGTATNAGNLTGKFVRWVDNSLPGLKATFSDAEVETLQKIAADIKRAEVAAAAGMSRNSATYGNAANALSLGILDSPAINVLAQRVPVLNQFAPGILGAMREGGRKAKAEELAALLLDPQAGAEAINSLLLPGPEFYGVKRGLLYGAPVVAAD